MPKNLPSDVRTIFETNSNFERGMAALAARDSTFYYPFLREMARYFARFKPNPNNQYIRLFRCLLENRVSFCVATLNYENVIEHALTLAGGKGGSVIKPHGSCSYLPIPTPIRGAVFEGLRSDLETDTIVNTDPDFIDKWCRDPGNESVGPAMSFYMPGKDTKINRKYIQHERTRFAKMLRDCNICFVVGVACVEEDEHIWKPIAEAKCRLVYVNPCDAGFGDWLMSSRRKYAAPWPKTFEDAVPKLIADAS